MRAAPNCGLDWESKSKPLPPLELEPGACCWELPNPLPEVLPKAPEELALPNEKLEDWAPPKPPKPPLEATLPKPPDDVAPNPPLPVFAWLEDSDLLSLACWALCALAARASAAMASSMERWLHEDCTCCSSTCATTDEWKRGHAALMASACCFAASSAGDGCVLVASAPKRDTAETSSAPRMPSNGSLSCPPATTPRDSAPAMPREDGSIPRASRAWLYRPWYTGKSLTRRPKAEDTRSCPAGSEAAASASSASSADFCAACSVFSRSSRAAVVARAARSRVARPSVRLPRSSPDVDNASFTASAVEARAESFDSSDDRRAQMRLAAWANEAFDLATAPVRLAAHLGVRWAGNTDTWSTAIPLGESCAPEPDGATVSVAVG